MMRFYRTLLRLYPASFRDEYGDELYAAFAARHSDVRGGAGQLTMFVAALADVIPNAVAEHLEILRYDLRYTWRALRRAPAFTVTAVLVVALGVGANTAAFSVADFALLRPLPFPHPNQLVKVWESVPGYGRYEFSPGNYRDLQAGATSFSALGVYVPTAMNLSGRGDPLRVESAAVTATMLPLLGVQPAFGRMFTVADTVAGQSVIVSNSLWRTYFGADESVIGAHVSLDGKSYTVIGVMPATFGFPTRTTALWTTVGFAAGDFDDRGNNYLKVVGRLKPGVTVERALSEANLIAAQAERRYPKDNEHVRASVNALSDEMSQRARLLLIALCGATLCILLLACANLASLLLARASSREREIAVRAALGAGRERLVRQVVTESLMLALLGGIAGVALAVVAVPALARLVPSTLPVNEQPSVDLRVLLFAAATIALTGLAFGIVPALRAGRADSMTALRDGARAGGGRKQRVRAALVSVEVMASLVLLVASGLLVRAMLRIESVDPGIETSDVLTARTALAWPKYAEPLVRERFYNTVLSDLRALPGVSGAAYASFLPIAMGGGIWPVIINGRNLDRNGADKASLRLITPQYFSTLRIPLLRGRDVAETDDAGHPYTAVVSQSFVTRYWPREDPIGKRFTIGLHERTIVGIAGDVRVRGLEIESEPQVYVPSQQVDSGSLVFYTPKDLVIRSSSSPATLIPELRRIVHEADPQQPLSDVRTMDDIVSTETAPRASQLRVLAILAIIALLLSGVGIHGLLSFTVSQRTQEIGVRMALGAETREIVGMIMRQGLTLALLGAVPGIALAYAAGRAMQALLAGVSPSDPVSLTIGLCLCVVATVVGCARPALRAARVDPISALRSD
ncbi:MAG TPA: ABC transporter permease [Gemmatimonadaceae bacterium]|jgi:putative ABC transport system permease protein